MIKEGKSKKTAQKSIRTYCVHDCMAGQFNQVKLCHVQDCPLFIFKSGRKYIEPDTEPEIRYCGRDGSQKYYFKVRLTRIRAIKFKCLDCSAGYRDSAIELNVKNCSVKDCVLYPFRLGKNPNRQREK